MPTVVSILDLDPRKFGSMEEYAVFLSRALRQRVWRNVLVFAQPVGPGILQYFGGTGAILEALPASGKLSKYLHIVEILRKYKADVAHFHFFEHYSLLPLWAAIARPKLLIFTDHWRQPLSLSPLNKVLCILWDRLIFSFLGIQFLAVSEHIKRTLVECYGMAPERIRVLHNGVNVDRFLPRETDHVVELRKTMGLPPYKPLVVSVAALIPQKGIDDLLVAAQQVLAEKPETLFVIVGEGPLLDHLCQKASELAIAANVRFVGLRSDVQQFMAVANVVAVPSVWQEPAGLTVIEAMASGRPVVATRVGGIPEYMVHEVTGILVEPEAPEQLARAILRLLNSENEANEMGRAGRAKVETTFSMERWVCTTLDLYARAISTRTRP